MLVLRPGALGDTLLAVPALRALRRAYGSITLAAHPGAARLLAHVGEIDGGFSFDHLSLSWVLTGQNVPDEKVVAWMAATNASGLRSAEVVAPSRPSGVQHCARYLLSTLAPLGIDLTWDDHPLAITPISSTEILVHPGSGSPAKNWPPERFAALVRALEQPVRFIVGEADHASAEQIENCLGSSIQRMNEPSLEVLAARLAGCRAYVGNDSGVSHLAGLSGVHTFALFGPTNPVIWRPLGPRVHVVPCDTDPTELAKRVLSSEASG